MREREAEREREEDEEKEVLKSHLGKFFHFHDYAIQLEKLTRLALMKLAERIPNEVALRYTALK